MDIYKDGFIYTNVVGFTTKGTLVLQNGNIHPCPQPHPFKNDEDVTWKWERLAVTDNDTGEYRIIAVPIQPTMYEAGKIYHGKNMLPTESEGKKQVDCAANHLNIDTLLSEFKRQGFDTSNWDGEEGAEKAIVDGVVNHISELTPSAGDIKPLSELEQIALNTTLKMSAKKQPTLSGRENSVSDEWVSVEERLPEDMTEVLLAVKYQNEQILAYRSNGKWYGSRETRDWMIDGYCENSELNKCIEITHWRKLPPLPNQSPNK